MAWLAAGCTSSEMPDADGGAADATPVVDGLPVSDVAPAVDSSGRVDRLRPVEDRPATDRSQPTDGLPPLDRGLLADTPSADARPAIDTAPAVDVAPRLDTPLLVDVGPAADASPAADSALVDAAPAADGPPAADAAVAADGGSDGRPPTFNVASAASTGNTRMVVTFDAPPDPVQARRLANYSVPDLTLNGTPALYGSTVTLVTSSQRTRVYRITVGGVTRASDGEPLTHDSASFTGHGAGGPTTFNVFSAASTGNTEMTVTFDAPPEPSQAVVLGNYQVPGLTLSGTPALGGNTVTLATSEQAAVPYSVTVSGVTRASDGEALTKNTASFAGRTTFNLVAAASTGLTSMTVTFDAPPNHGEATAIDHYSVPGLSLSGSPTLDGNTVTITTSTQEEIAYQVTVDEVTRASDGQPLSTRSAGFTGSGTFNVVSAASSGPTTMTVTFDAPPDPSSVVSGSYSVPGLALSDPVLGGGSTVSLTTTLQTAAGYTVTVAGVTRASDAAPLDNDAADFTAVPSVTNVEVLSTSPSNGSIPYNTGTATLRITGTGLASVNCPANPNSVRLDDTDGNSPPLAVNTAATSCAVDSATQLTAVLPPGIRTNGSTGWNVRVTNLTGTSSTSAQRFVPRAGLLISEVFTGVSGGSTREFIELYNPTGTAIDALDLGLKLHTVSSTGSDTSKTLSAVTSGPIPSHGFWLIISSQSLNTDAWYPYRDMTYSASSAGLVAAGGVYVSLSSTDHRSVIDKLGWGNAGNYPVRYEATPVAEIASGYSAERKPATGGDHSTDTDDNSSDFNPPSTSITPRGSTTP